MKYILVITSLLISSLTFAGQDFGKISKLYIDMSGIMAIQLDEGFPASASLCTSSNGWAYVPANAPPELKSLLLAAKASKARLQVTINECANGNALQVHAVTEI